MLQIAKPYKRGPKKLEACSWSTAECFGLALFGDRDGGGKGGRVKTTLPIGRPTTTASENIEYKGTPRPLQQVLQIAL